MCSMEKVASCQLSFIPIGNTSYLNEIHRVLDIIKKSGLEIDIGPLSTVVIGKKDLVLNLIKDIYEEMDDICEFTMDVKISNICGCN